MNLAQYENISHGDQHAGSRSLTPSPQKQKKTKKEKKSKKKKKKKDSSSDSDYSEDTPSPKKKKSKKKKKKSKAVDELAASVAELESKARARNKVLDEDRKKRAPMTKEEWDKQQSVVRREFDEDTGRVRLVKVTEGDIEVCFNDVVVCRALVRYWRRSSVVIEPRRSTRPLLLPMGTASREMSSPGWG